MSLKYNLKFDVLTNYVLLLQFVKEPSRVEEHSRVISDMHAN